MTPTLSGVGGGGMGKANYIVYWVNRTVERVGSLNVTWLGFFLFWFCPFSWTVRRRKRGGGGGGGGGVVFKIGRPTWRGWKNFRRRWTGGGSSWKLDNFHARHIRSIPNLTGRTSYKLKMRGKRTRKCNCPLSISPFLAYIEGIKILNLMKKRERFLLLCA